jgi:hypothetical protein
MDTFEQRILWIITNRKYDGRNGVAEAADVDRKSLDTAIQRANRKPTKPVRGEIVGKIARAAKVNRHWLETGEGVPDLTPEGTAHIDPHEMRAQAARMIATGLNIEFKDAWFLMLNAKPKETSVEGFFTAGIELYRASREQDGAVKLLPAPASNKDVLDASKASAAAMRRRR